MKRKPVIKRQAVKRRGRQKPSNIWRTTYLLGSYGFKLSLMLAVVAGISFMFLSVYQYLLSSPYIRLERVVIKGVDGDLKRALLRMSQLSVDTSLLAIKMNELRQRIERHPWIRSVSLEKRFPHTLIIRAEKEKPMAVVIMDGLHYMNREGKIFERVEQTGQIDYPIITGLSARGSDREMKYGLAARVLEILQAEKGPLSLEELSEIHVRDKTSVSLYFLSVPAVIQADGSLLGKKMGELKRLVEHLNRTGHIHVVRAINLDYRDGAVVSLKEGASKIPNVS